MMARAEFSLLTYAIPNQLNFSCNKDATQHIAVDSARD
jgi:hypothetical protein